MVSAPVRRQQASLAQARGVSQRRACALLSTARSSLRYESRMDQRDGPLLAAMRGLAAEFGPWRTFEAVGYAVLEWVDWFNNRRLLEPFGSIPPAKAEANYYAALKQSDMAA